VYALYKEYGRLKYTSQAVQKEYAKKIYLHLCCGYETWFFTLKEIKHRQRILYITLAVHFLNNSQISHQQNAPYFHFFILYPLHMFQPPEDGLIKAETYVGGKE
jgi:hypothetical protein